VLRKRDLVLIVERQVEKWPHQYFKPANSTVDTLRSFILDPECGFTKTVAYEVGADSAVVEDEGTGGIIADEGEFDRGTSSTRSCSLPQYIDLDPPSSES
jgi:hypothetical protein